MDAQPVGPRKSPVGYPATEQSTFRGASADVCSCVGLSTGWEYGQLGKGDVEKGKN